MDQSEILLKLGAQFRDTLDAMHELERLCEPARGKRRLRILRSLASITQQQIDALTLLSKLADGVFSEGDEWKRRSDGE